MQPVRSKHKHDEKKSLDKTQLVASHFILNFFTQTFIIIIINLGLFANCYILQYFQTSPSFFLFYYSREDIVKLQIDILFVIILLLFYSTQIDWL